MRTVKGGKGRPPRAKNTGVALARYDPSRTASLRKALLAKTQKPYDLLAGEVLRLIVDMDAFGLLPAGEVGINILNFDQSQPRDSKGRWSRVGARIVRGLKAAGASIGAVEHFAKDRLTMAFARLPTRVQQGITLTFKAAFATWTAGQAFAERVAVERGMSPEKARRLRGILVAADLATFKPITVGLASIPGVGLGTAAGASFIPPASTAYLLYSSSRAPYATWRAARGVVKDGATRLASKVRSWVPRSRRSPTPQTQLPGTKLGITELVVSALHDSFEEYITWNRFPSKGEFADLLISELDAHSRDGAWDDWYICLLMTAADELGDFRQALALADLLHQEEPQSPVENKFGAPPKQNSPQGSFRVANVGSQEWRFRTDDEKVKEFEIWLRKKVGDLVHNRGQDSLWQAYVTEGFKKGAGRAFDDASIREIATQPMEFIRGARDRFLQTSLLSPESTAKVKLLVSRTLEDLKGVTETMARQMSRVLADGLVQRKNPREIARDLIGRVRGIGKVRADIIARTEIIRAHAEGQLHAFEDLGVDELGVMVEWSTAGDGRVCPLCAELRGIVVKTSEAHGMIPRHPRCRCAFIPANVGERRSGQVRGAPAIRSRLRRSRKLGNPSWSTGKRISTKRPKSVLNEPFETYNDFCPTGPGGGIDPTCKRGAMGHVGSDIGFQEGGSSGGGGGGTTLVEQAKIGVPFSIVKDTETSYSAEFMVGDDWYSFNGSAAEVAPRTFVWSVSFRDEVGRYTLTGEAGYKAIAVMRTVGKILDKFVDEKQPTEFVFSADTSEPSRVKLYAKAAELIARRNGYSLGLRDRLGGQLKEFKFNKNRVDNVMTNNIPKRDFDEEFDEVFAEELKALGLAGGKEDEEKEETTQDEN